MQRSSVVTRRSPVARRRQALTGLAFASPFVVGFVIFIAYPVLASAFYSFTDFNLFQAPEFVGFDNYERMATDSSFWTALANTLVLTAIGVPLAIVIAISGAHLLNLPVRGQPLFRALVYLPSIVPVVVGGYLWRWLLNGQYGFMNYFLGLVGIDGPGWLQEPAWGKPAIIIMSLWTVGGTMIIYLAALKDVPADLYEAAALDGAGPFARFRHITWPVLSPVTLFQIIVNIIAYLQIFTQPYLLAQTRLNNAGSGPGQSFLTYAMYLYQNAFSFFKMGYASAMAWVLFLITLVITLVVLISSRRWVHSDSR
ncbi:carbohydrate ABC transporter permease [Glaciibacter psychrotolerans]|uniref:Multiple sugar transport system permease protein n=1 Tax=Glaciibacter psychrotolerans TaxID=670054 RepID=A0A7Z0EDY1_9MICO|nr:sugar ABC transporter permease [Leifsonia psychrotolerans]NYJ19723.1 multiple sugar transport system permease protein [Leifsonia psychrotolerans]